jgi:hypothetical protein
MDDHQLSYMIKMKEKKKKNVGSLFTNWVDMKDLKKTKATIPSSYIHMGYLCHVWWEKKPKRFPFLQATYIYIYKLLMSYLGFDSWDV